MEVEHTGDRFSVDRCECSECTSARQARLMRAVEFYRPSQFARIEAEIERADQALKDAAKMSAQAWYARADFLREVEHDIFGREAS